MLETLPFRMSLQFIPKLARVAFCERDLRHITECSLNRSESDLSAFPPVDDNSCRKLKSLHIRLGAWCNIPMRSFFGFIGPLLPYFFILEAYSTPSLPNATSCLLRSFNATNHSGCDECYGTLTTIDCNKAIQQLPNDLPSDVTYDPTTKTFTYPLFSKTISNPRFNLPIEEDSGDCLVQISLARNVRSDRSLWSIIRRRAGAIISECMVDGHGVGGYETTGENEGIRITLQQATGGLTLPNLSNGNPLSTPVETA